MVVVGAYRPCIVGAAGLAAAGEREKLEVLQDKLKGGRRA